MVAIGYGALVLISLVLLTMYLDGYWDRRRTRLAQRHQHDWSKWVKIGNVIYTLTKAQTGSSIQERSCNTCGESQRRKVAP